MDLGLLEDFLELARVLNFSRAAELRHTTQPAFSRRIQALEAEVGAPLVRRTSRSVALTAAGHAYRPRAAALLRLSTEARHAALEAAGASELVLSLAATHALSFTFVPRWLMQVGGPAALGTLNMVSDSQEGCERLMLRGETSFFVCHRYPAAEGGLPEGQFRHRTVGADRLVPVSAPDAAGGPAWTFDTGGGAALLDYGPASGLSRILAAHWREHGRPEMTTRMSSLLAATNLEMAKAGQGIAWLPLSLAEDDLAAGRLVRAGDGAFDVPVEIVICRPRSRLLAPRRGVLGPHGRRERSLIHAGRASILAGPALEAAPQHGVGEPRRSRPGILEGTSPCAFSTSARSPSRSPHRSATPISTFPR